MPLGDLLQVRRRVTVRDLEVGLLREEGEVGEGVDLGLAVSAFVERVLRKDVVDLKTAQLAEEMLGEFDACWPGENERVMSRKLNVVSRGIWPIVWF